MRAIEIKQLTKSYVKNIRALDQIDINVEEKEIYGFIGSNGAGKSTTIRLLLNYIFPTSGEAKIFGLDSVKDAREIKKMTGYVPSEVNFYKSYRVRDVFQFSMKMNEQTDQEYLNFLIQYFEVEPNKLVKDLSLGNRKKVSLIQALLKKPKLLILDEPTSGLDPVIQEKLFKHLIELKEKGMTIFLSSHNLAEVDKYCDRVSVIRRGKIVHEQSIKKIEQSRKLVCKYRLKNSEKLLTEEVFEKDIDTFVKKISKLSLDKIEIQPMSLEEMFIQYYNEELKEETHE